VWGGIVGAQLQLSETNTTGENYTNPGHDTNNNTIWKHDWDKGLGNVHGTAPVLATSATFDVMINWTVDNDGVVNTYGLMMASVILMGMDAAWFTDTGAPEVSEEHAYQLLHWTPEQWMEANEELTVQVLNLTDQIMDLEGNITNGTELVDELMAEIAYLEENLTAMQDDLNDSLENETILLNQTEWLRELLEETNETVDDLEHQVTVLESKVERLEDSVAWKDENVTLMEEQLRSERYNVTQLQWQLDNASAALRQAEADLAAAVKELDDTQKEYEDLQSRTMLVAVAALIAGMILVVVILKLLGKI
jgi:polyhydroxyalkanoate synthesis regulator phasin